MKNVQSGYYLLWICSDTYGFNLFDIYNEIKAHESSNKKDLIAGFRAMLELYSFDFPYV